MSRRKLIQMTPEEIADFLRESRTATLATHGPHGYPHAVAMWFDADPDRTVWMTTYRKSQKAVNIRRNPRVAVSLESGVTYDTLKGVLIRGDAELIDAEEVVLATLRRIHEKMTGSFPEGVDEAMRAQARKRVAIRVRPWRISSWDHSKLAGAY